MLLAVFLLSLILPIKGQPPLIEERGGRDCRQVATNSAAFFPQVWREGALLHRSLGHQIKNPTARHDYEKYASSSSTENFFFLSLSIISHPRSDLKLAH